MKYFLISFDRPATGNYKLLHDSFVENQGIRRWFHYIKTSYIVGTTLNSNEIADRFAEACDKANIPKLFIVIAVDMSDRNGYLTPDAWDWLKRNST